jgi:ribose transport system permease protein
MSEGTTQASTPANDAVEQAPAPSRGRLEDLQERLGSQAIVYLIFLAIIVYFAIQAPSFATTGSLANIGRQSAAIVIVGVGMTIVIINAEIDLSVGSMVSFTGAFVATLLAHGWPWLAAVAVALAAGGIIGAFNGFVTAYVGVPSFLVTLGMLELLGAAALMITSTVAVPITDVTFTDVLGARSLLSVPVPVWWAVLIVAIGVYVMRKTVYGRWVYATGGNRSAAIYSGIRTNQVVLISFIVSGFLAAFAGLLLAGRSSAGDPTVGTGMELSAIAAVILGGTDLFGGRGSVLGTVIGALFIGVVGIGLVLLGASAQLQQFITGGIIIGAVSINRLAGRARAHAP